MSERTDGQSLNNINSFSSTQGYYKFKNSQFECTTNSNLLMDCGIVLTIKNLVSGPKSVYVVWVNTDTTLYMYHYKLENTINRRSKQLNQ